MNMKEFLGEVLSPGAACGNLCFFDSGMSTLANAAQRLIEGERKEIQLFGKQVEAVADELETVVEILNKDSYVEECATNDPVFRQAVESGST